MKKKVILSSVVTIALCLSLIAGSTYALFTDKEVVGVEVTAGKVDITATPSALKTFAFGKDTWDNKPAGDRFKQYFQLGGTAELVDNVLTLDKMVPGDAATVTLNVTNASNVATKYKVRVYIEDGADATAAVDSDLADVLVSTATFNGKTVILEKDAVNNEAQSEWLDLAVGTNIGDVEITVSFPNADTDQNKYQENTAKVYFQIIAVQANGTSDYDRVNETDTTAVAP